MPKKKEIAIQVAQATKRQSAASPAGISAAVSVEVPELLPMGHASDAPGWTGQKTARLAAEILRDDDNGFVIPNAKQRAALAIAYVTSGFIIYGKAFDIVRSPPHVDLHSVDSICAHLDEIVIFEIKSTSKRTVKPDFRGYFFAISAAELLVTQNLGDRYRFAFVNTLTRQHIELTLQQVFSRARGIYPTWSISF